MKNPSQVDHRSDQAEAAPVRSLVLKKPVEIIHSVPSDGLTLIQRKMANAWLKNALETQQDEGGWWSVGVAELSRNIEFDSKDQALLIESAKALMKIVFEWDVISTFVKSKSKWKASVLFPEVEIDPGVIRYQISKPMFERIFAPEIYALINLNVINKFRSSSSLALYEHCIRFWRVGKTTDIKWELLRGILLGERSGVKTYQEYKFFKAYVLKKAIADVNDLSDIRIELIETRLGRRVNTLTFTVAKVQPTESKVEINPQVFQELQDLGASDQVALDLCKEYPDTIAAALRFVRMRMKEGKVKSPIGFLRDALRLGYCGSPEESTPEAQPGACSKAAPEESREQAHHAAKAAQEREALARAQLYLDGLSPQGRAELESGFAEAVVGTLVDDHYRKRGLGNKLVHAALLKYVLETHLTGK